MTTEERHHWPAETGPGLVQGEQPLMQPGTDQDYRRLEHHYRHSAEYASMVERYPVLRRTIADTRGARLEGHPAAAPRADEHSMVLQWDRSHGEL